eukprot:CAMPEP_0174830002 /NCGR_PEP_ID=MMETSP1114-20130205/2281_1 /TAXON_ID=312471 /ORGANISM="Neobodo designis, Strain CCAP 1951/1" /LENGTH=579 /DNA_ID=CAMNT_0016063785 /DNA_START=122 /DNA_END=1861 /DNA_ORIENTATION=-
MTSRGSTPTPAASPLAATSTTQLIQTVAVMSAGAKLAGMAVAWALEHPRCAPARQFVASRAPLRGLLDYSLDWLDAVVTEGAIVALESAAMLGITKFVSAPLGRHVALAAVTTDIAARTVLPQPLRPAARIGGGPRLDTNTGFRRHVLPTVLDTPVFAFAAMQALRVATRAVVCITVRHYVKGDTYLRPRGILAQSIGQGLAQGAMACAAVAATKAVGRTWLGNPMRGGSLWLWQLTFALSFHVSGMAAAKVVGALNKSLQDAVIKRWLYRPLPGVNNSRHRLFDLQELQRRFGLLSATELSEVSQFGNEALRSASIDHATRLHAVRFLAALTAYVKAVNAGALRRAGKMESMTSVAFKRRAEASSTAASPASVSNSTMVFPADGTTASSSSVHPSTAAATSTTTTEADFQSHVFTEEQIAERAAAGNPFKCVSCNQPFRSADRASVLPCGHILHAGACSRLEVDWCPLCVRPTHSPSNDERMAVFLGMKHYVEALATEWERDANIIPERLRYAEWTYVAQYVRLHKVVEGEVPLDVVPHHFRPGLKSVIDIVLENVLWALHIAPTNAPAQVLAAKGGW